MTEIKGEITGEELAEFFKEYFDGVIKGAIEFATQKLADVAGCEVETTVTILWANVTVKFTPMTKTQKH